VRTLVWIFLVAGCTEPAPYHCRENRQCRDGMVQGVCEANGWCSFPDSACASHQRYASAAASTVAGQCTQKGDDCIAEILGGGTTENGLDVGHTCVRKNDGTVWCWGDNSLGQLANDGPSSAMPAQVPLSAAATSITSGEIFACALLMNGDVECWGDNQEGQLGAGDPRLMSPVPLKVAAAKAARAIGAGGGHACLIDSDERAACWGENGNNQIAPGAADPQTTPFYVPDLARGVAIGAGDQHSCALLDDTSVRCWGSNALGQLGQGDGSPASSIDPVQVKGLLSAQSIRLGDQHTCALLNDTTLLCWGTNVSGTVGNGSPMNANLPLQILDGVAVVATSGDAKHTCAAKIDGTLWCWGNNDSGQVGLDPARTVKSPTPVQLPLSSVRLVGAGAHHSCAVTYDGTVWCWGSNHSGQLGLAGTTQELTPRRVPFHCN
jgi:alpha-tubulin suppressor-like RCC1 family protein